MTIPPIAHGNQSDQPRTDSKFASWFAPFASAWRARGYFLIAIVFWLLNSTIPLPFKDIPEAQRLWWQDLVDKALGSFDKVCYAAFVAGLAYAVISDAFSYIWGTKLEAEFRRSFAATGDILRGSLSHFTSGLVGMSFEAVKVWVEGGRGERSQTRLIGASSLKSYYGVKSGTEQNLVDFILDDLMEHSAQPTSQTWANMISNITIRSSSTPGHMEWEEEKSYSVVCSALNKQVPLALEASFRIDAPQLHDALERMQYNVRFGSEDLLDFHDWWVKNKPTTMQPKFVIEVDGVSLQYDGLWLRFGFRKDCTIAGESTFVRVYERSLISNEDRCYVVVIRHPTKGLQVSMRLEGLTDWAMKPAVASASLYPAPKNVVEVHNQHEYSAQVRVTGWTMPGVALVAEWTPTT